MINIVFQYRFSTPKKMQNERKRMVKSMLRNSSIFLHEYQFTVENKNKNKKKDIHQASKHLRIPGTNLKTIKFNNI